MSIKVWSCELSVDQVGEIPDATQAVHFGAGELDAEGFLDAGDDEDLSVVAACFGTALPTANRARAPRYQGVRGPEQATRHLTEFG